MRKALQTMAIAASVTSLCIVATISAGQWPEKDSVAYCQFELMRHVPARELGMVSFPVDRLKANTTTSWIYTLPICEPLRVKKVTADRLVVNDGVSDFRLEGEWRAAVHETKRACQNAWIEFARARVQGRVPAVRATLVDTWGVWSITGPAPEPEPGTVQVAPDVE